jgi:hypothetical protein
MYLESIVKLVEQYNENSKSDSIINRELITFEYEEHKKKEWLQVAIALITDPLMFHEESSYIRSWISTEMNKKIVDEMYQCLIELINKLEEKEVPFAIGNELISIVEKRFTSIAQSLNNVKKI